jgi:hypothetical protein
MSVLWERIRQYRHDFTVEEYAAFLHFKSNSTPEDRRSPQPFRAYVYEDAVAALRANHMNWKRQRTGYWTFCACKLDEQGNNIIEKSRTQYSDRDPTEFIRISAWDSLESAEDAAAAAKVQVERNGFPHYLVEVIFDYPPHAVLQRMFEDEVGNYMTSTKLLERIQYMRSLLETAGEENLSLWRELEATMEKIEEENEKRRCA